MVELVSPGYDLEIFCRQMLGKNLIAVIKETSAEIGNARKLHLEATKGKDFPIGSKGSKYCSNLQRLVSILVNGSVPNNASQEFLNSIRRLIINLLQKWEIGNLRSVFSNIRDAEFVGLSEIVDPLIVVISKFVVETGNPLWIVKIHVLLRPTWKKDTGAANITPWLHKQHDKG